MTFNEKQQKADTLILKASECEKGGNFMAAGNLYSQALKLYKDLKDRKKLNFCKSEMLRMNRLASQHQYKCHTFQIPIKKEEMDPHEKVINDLAAKPIEEVLEIIGKSPLFYLSYKEVLELAHNNMPISLQLVSLSATDDDGHTLRDSTNPKDFWIMEMYKKQQELILILNLLPLLKQIIKNDKLNPESLMQFINKFNIVPEKTLPILTKGFYAFFEEDYISSLHILVPSFESVFLNISKNLGINTIKLNRGQDVTTEQIALSDFHLDSAEFRKVWGEDLCEQISFILFRPMGYCLRHRVAHGRISQNECSFEFLALVLYLYIAIAARITMK